jgi:UDP-glucose 4-epimerase
MKILITGGCGFIGSNLTDILLADNHEVIVIDNLVSGKEENCNPGATYILEDVADVLIDEKQTAQLQDIEIIFHLAAMPRIQPSFKDPLYTLRNNTQGTAIVCEFARHVGAKVVYAGSSTFYGGVYLNPYAFSKWAGEEVCKMYSQIYGLTTSIARFFNVYGPRHLKTGPYSTVVGIFEEQYEQGIPLTITSDGEQRRDFTHVNDICKGLVAMSSGDHKGTVFNLGSGMNYSINELAAMYTDAAVVYIPRRPGEAKETLADTSAIYAATGWSADHSLKLYVEEFLGHTQRKTA